MTRVVKVVAVLVACGVGSAQARDERQRHPIQAALTTGEAKAKLDQGVRLFFGDAKHPPIARDFGTWASNKKTNAANKSDAEACNWAFLSAMLALQKRARSAGGDAVVEIVSEYKNQPFSSAKEYECGAGNFVTGVAFRGRVVKLAR